MTPRDRVLSVLQGTPVDRIPWIEHGLDRRLVMRAMIEEIRARMA